MQTAKNRLSRNCQEPCLPSSRRAALPEHVLGYGLPPRVKLMMLAAALALAPLTLWAQERLPESGDQATAFEGKDINGEAVNFAPAKQNSWTVLVFLRGFPGYQCPICSRQVGELIAKAEEFAVAKTQVIFIYPGPNKDLTIKAQEFMAGKSLPTGFQLIVDTDFKIVNAYHLRWDAPRETAFPSTFVIDPSGTIRLAKISKTHGGRASVQEILDVVAAKKAEVKKDPRKE